MTTAVTLLSGVNCIHNIACDSVAGPLPVDCVTMGHCDVTNCFNWVNLPDCPIVGDVIIAQEVSQSENGTAILFRFIFSYYICIQIHFAQSWSLRGMEGCQ